MDRSLQQPKPTHAVPNSPLSAREMQHLRDDQCEGDILWEQRMRKLNPNWQPSENSLWDAYHE